MKTYYLCAERSIVNGGFTVSVRDNARGLEILKEFQAENYSDAVKQYRFSVSNMGKTAYCGVNVNGEPFHGEV